MEDKQKRAFLLAGLVLYIFDLGSYIYVAVQYWKNYELWWFGMTVMFISVPSLFVNGAAIIQIRNIGTFLAAIFQLSIAVRLLNRSSHRTGRKKWRIFPDLLACNTSLHRDNR